MRGMASHSCCVCFEPTADLTHPCRHPVCDACLSRWLLRDRVDCPICRDTLLYGPRQDGGERWADDNVVLVCFSSDPLVREHVGIRLRQAGRQVVVQAVHRKDLAHARGVRAGDTLSYVNNIPIVSVRSAIRVVDAATERKHSLVLTVRRPKRHQRWLSGWATRLFARRDVVSVR